MKVLFFAAAILWSAATASGLAADTGSAASFAWVSYAGHDPVWLESVDGVDSDLFIDSDGRA
jgi:hypothetical protein